jgi:ribose 1,5-bisphosphokinase
MPPGSNETPPIGPGRLIAVVGPSGAGKDTLLELARAHFRDDRNVVFPRRIITREPSAAEDNEGISGTAFAAATAAGDFALWWEAHGLSYALPAAIDNDIRAGRTAVCNVSRAIVDLARRRYAEVCVVLVTAPAEILATRLASRARTSDGAIDGRIGRVAPSAAELLPDVVIENIADPRSAAARLVAAIAGYRI